MPHVNEKYRSLTEFFPHLNFLLSRNQRYEQTTTLFSLYSSFCSATKSLQIFCFISRCKIHSKKNDLKKDFSNTPLRVVEKAPQNNSNSLNCKKPRAPQNSSAQLTASQR